MVGFDALWEKDTGMERVRWRLKKKKTKIGDEKWLEKKLLMEIKTQVAVDQTRKD